jgi:YidC/Oxa1 family membrane protein insertase
MDRRFLAAIGLMMLVVLAPTFLFKRRPTPSLPAAGAVPTIGAPDTATVTSGTATAVPSPAPTAAAPAPRQTSLPEDTVSVRSGLYEYVFSTRGARLIGARLLRYRSMAVAPAGQGFTEPEAELVQPEDGLFALTLVAGGDSLPLGNVSFTPSATDLRVEGRTTLTFTATVEGAAAEVTYAFRPDDYRIDVAGRVTGLGPTGGLLLVGMGSGIRNTEADSTLNYRDYALVVRRPGRDPQAIPFRKFDVDSTRTEAGPFDWAALKSKYFVIGAFAADSAASWAAAEVRRTDPAKLPHRARLRLSLPVASSGAFGWSVYAGPMEYPRLGAMGREFNDVNPYGWPGFRTVMRPFALGFRWLFVQMHERLGLAYGVVLLLTGVLLRLILWPLNQKAMRSAMEMQALQPKLQALQARYKEEPQKLQQEMFALYKEHNVNPMSGCWPMLLPMPILLAIFFVLNSTIEVRGVPFLWFPDLARPDPLYIIPVVSGLAMFALSKLGQRGLPPNPQAKLMVFMMPAMMTLFGFNFASGLNLYWAASNIASLPQQYLIGRERMRRQGAPVVGTKR